MPALKIPVDRLTGRPEPFFFEADAGWWTARESARLAGGAANPQGGDESVQVQAPFRFALEAARQGDDILLEGELEGRLGLECSRCGTRYPHALREPWRLRLEPVDERTEVDPEGERGLTANGLCLGEELEAGWYRGPLLRLDDFFGELIALAMPLQPLCDEGCPGVCPYCGARRVGESATGGAAAGCGCEEEKIESPFAVLASLKRSE